MCPCGEFFSLAASTPSLGVPGNPCTGVDNRVQHSRALRCPGWSQSACGHRVSGGRWGGLGGFPEGWGDKARDGHSDVRVQGAQGVPGWGERPRGTLPGGRGIRAIPASEVPFSLERGISPKQD